MTIRSASAAWSGGIKDGKGAFNLLYSRHQANQHITLRAAFDTKSCDGGIVPDFAQRADAHAFLTSASAAFRGTSPSVTSVAVVAMLLVPVRIDPPVAVVGSR